MVEGYPTYSLKDKTLVRIDLDENLRKARDLETGSSSSRRPSTGDCPRRKSEDPFRMEMSAFARHEGSIPVIGDIGQVWPVLAWKVAGALGIPLDFLATPSTPRKERP